MHQRHQDATERLDERALRADPIASRRAGAMLAELEAPRRTVVTSYLEGHTMPEVAAMMGWTAKKASNTLFRTIGHLRRSIHVVSDG